MDQLYPTRLNFPRFSTEFDDKTSNNGTMITNISNIGNIFKCNSITSIPDTPKQVSMTNKVHCSTSPILLARPITNSNLNTNTITTNTCTIRNNYKSSSESETSTTIASPIAIIGVSSVGIDSGACINLNNSMKSITPVAGNYNLGPKFSNYASPKNSHIMQPPQMQTIVQGQIISARQTESQSSVVETEYLKQRILELERNCAIKDKSIDQLTSQLSKQDQLNKAKLKILAKAIIDKDKRINTLKTDCIKKDEIILNYQKNESNLIGIVLQKVQIKLTQSGGNNNNNKLNSGDNDSSKLNSIAIKKESNLSNQIKLLEQENKQLRKLVFDHECQTKQQKMYKTSRIGVSNNLNFGTPQNQLKTSQLRVSQEQNVCIFFFFFFFLWCVGSSNV